MFRMTQCFTSTLNITQWTIHGQTTFKQRYFNVYDVYTTLFQRRLTMMCPLGKLSICNDSQKGCENMTSARIFPLTVFLERTPYSKFELKRCLLGRIRKWALNWSFTACCGTNHSYSLHFTLFLGKTVNRKQLKFSVRLLKDLTFSQQWLKHQELINWLLPKETLSQTCSRYQ